jgi:transcriptional antiterminator RfaH
MKRWYALYTKPREEVWARTNLEERGLEVYLPRYLKRRSHARKVEMVKMPLFPRYIFARADVSQGERPAMAYAPGVEYVLSFGNELGTVNDRLIEEIRQREDENGLVTMGMAAKFKAGQQVRVEGGAFSDHVGLFQCSSDNERVFVLLNLMGGSVRVHLPMDSISAEI